MQIGDQLWPNQQLCEIPDLSSMQVKVPVGETDAPKVSKGLPVLIKLEAAPGKLFHGTVVNISKLAAESDPWSGGTPGKRTFEVTIAVKETDPANLKPGMTADAEFIQQRLDTAVYVPIEAVTERDGKTWAFVKMGDKYKQVPVTTGIQNDSYVRITKGLTAGQTVALTDPEKAQVRRSLDDLTDTKKANSVPPLPKASKTHGNI